MVGAVSDLPQVKPKRAAAQTLDGSESYSRQYDVIFSEPLKLNRAVPKPDRVAQSEEPGGFPVLWSANQGYPAVYGTPKKNFFFGRKWEAKDLAYGGFIAGIHLLCLLAPMTFSWKMVGLWAASYFVTGCLGITLGYHRLLSHRSFTCPKWLEYFFAYCGAHAVQGDPLEWASVHRYHHLHTETPLDPHSSYEGFWWSHCGWLLDSKTTDERTHDRGNASDMAAQPFYRWMARTYTWHMLAQAAVLLAVWGLPGLVWGGAVRIAWVWHITWFVNSASHVWGGQTYDTQDLSRNNWWVAILAFGEGWHNNHHAFEYSARHGLDWWQFDMTWLIIRGLELVGLADKLKYPSEKAKARLAFERPLSQAQVDERGRRNGFAH